MNVSVSLSEFIGRQMGCVLLVHGLGLALFGVLCFMLGRTGKQRRFRALIASECRYHALINGSPNHIALFDDAGCYLTVNPAGEILMGLSKTELAGRSFISLWPDESRPIVVDAVNRVLGGSTCSFETNYLRPDGQKTVISVTLSPIADDKGSVSRFVGDAVDITKRKQAEDEVSLNDARTKILTQLSNMTDMSEKEMAGYAITAAARLTNSKIGYVAFMDENESSLTLEYSTEATTQCEALKGLVLCQTKQTGMQGGVVRHREPVVVNDHASDPAGEPDKPESHLPLTRYMSVPVLDGDRIVVVAAVGDKELEYDESDLQQLSRLMEGMWRIIRRKRVAHALELEKERLAITLRSIGDGVITTDAEGRIVLLNGTGETLTGWKEEEAISRDVSEVLRTVKEDTREAGASSVEQVIRTGQAVGLTSHTLLIAKDGAERHISHSAAPIRDASGNMVGTVVVFRDVTERKRAEKALQESEQRVRLKLDSILSPEGNIGNLELADILDIEAIQSLMDSFYELAHVPMSITDLKGRVLVGVGWQDICTKFHRVHPQTCKHCIESDTQLSASVPPGEFKLYKCKNGMWDVTTPIIIGGQHVGNLFSGQFFFENEPVNYDFFRSQAREHGFDEESYIAALDRVPRLSRETLNDGMVFFMKLADMISKLSYSNIKLARSLTERNALMDSLRDNQADLSRAQAVSHTGSWRLDLRNDEMFWSDEAYRIFGVPRETPLSYETFFGIIHPEDREYVEEKWNAALAGEPYDIEHRIIVDGAVKWVRERAELECDDQGIPLVWFGTVQDITERKISQQEREVTVEFLHLMNGCTGTSDLINSAVTFFKQQSGCDAVGIRLLDGDDYPYFKAQGFSEEFLQTENTLYTRDAAGEIIRDDIGYPVLECMCGNVIYGRFDPSKPFFTPRGSFWTNCTTELLASTAEMDRLTRTRNRCNREGYESVALIPLRIGEETLGLLQLNDRRKGMFSPTTMALWERLADQLSVAMAKLHAEEALRESEERYRTLFSSMGEGFALCEIICDEEGKPHDFLYLDANQALETHTGLRLSDVIGKTVRQVLPGIEPCWIEIYGRVALTGEPIRFENRIKELNRHFEVFAFSPAKGQFATVFMDITERKNAEESLKESEERYRTLVEGAPDGIFIADSTGRYVDVNSSGCKMVGYSREEILNMTIMDLLVSDELPKLPAAMERIQMGETIMSEWKLKHKDGHTVTIELSARILADGRMQGFHRDITKRKELETQLTQAQKLESIGHLAAGIAHEINTPTQYVGDNTRFLSDSFDGLFRLIKKYEELVAATRDAKPVESLAQEIDAVVQEVDLGYLEEEIPEAIRQSLEGVERITKIVRAMKEFSHPGTDEKTPTDINKAIETTVTVARNEWKYVAEMELDLDPSLPLVPCLPGDFNQVILNIVVNAAHAIADMVGDGANGKGKIRISTRHDGRWAQIRISDTGTGIPEHVRSRIFDPFFTTKQVGKGTGQGLAISHSVITSKHDGKLTFETEEGKGTTFVIRLPLEQEIGQMEAA